MINKIYVIALTLMWGLSSTHAEDKLCSKNKTACWVGGLATVTGLALYAIKSKKPTTATSFNPLAASPYANPMMMGNSNPYAAMMGSSTMGMNNMGNPYAMNPMGLNTMTGNPNLMALQQNPYLQATLPTSPPLQQQESIASPSLTTEESNQPSLGEHLGLPKEIITKLSSLPTGQQIICRKRLINSQRSPNPQGALAEALKACGV